MESSTAGTLSDYQPKGTPSKGSGGGGAGPTGGKGDRCLLSIEGVRLEEVANSQFLDSHHDVPPVGTRVVLRDGLVGARLAISTASGDEVIGFLPTSCNYLRICVVQGHHYAGRVVQSAQGPTPRVAIDLAPAR